ncbi:MAG TPA: hypothetical protein VFV52_12205 [Bacilli bacterium]|nr:hypothetical protein [Bacilli bacterium]
MKKFLKFFPFLLTFVLLYLLQVKLEADNRILPFTEPFGRTTEVGVTDLNREAQPIGDSRYVWLKGQSMVYATLDPKGEDNAFDKRPVPDADIRTYSKYRVIGDDVFWIGKGEVLKRATWQNNQWTKPQAVGQKALNLDVVQAGDKAYLLIGGEQFLHVDRITPSAVEELRKFPVGRVKYIAGTVDNQGVVHVGALEILSSETFNLRYLTLDTSNDHLSDARVIKRLAMSTQTMIADSSFGIDNKYGYFLMTERSTKTMSQSLKYYSFELANPMSGQQYPLVPKTAGGPTWTAYEGVTAPGQHDKLKIAFIAGYAKNNRVNGQEMFMSSFSEGRWNESDLTRVSNNQRLGLNPTFSEQDGNTTILYNVLYGSHDYHFYFNSTEPSYVKKTNVITSDDYKTAAFVIPEYLAIAFVLLMIAVSWPIASYLYLFYLVIRKEHLLLGRPNLHLFIGIVLYLASQIAVFLNYGKLDNYYQYAPTWMHTSSAITLLFLGAGVVSYLFTWLFQKVSYERSALTEFSYFAGINIWMTLMALSYFMAK